MSSPQKYAVVDVETTGGKFGEERITEIAVYIFDGKEVIDSFSTLINPQKKIDAFVVKLTGITDKMVARSPKFEEVAKRLVEMTQDCILVAHNADFDYRMLKQEFNALGFSFFLPVLDTITLSQKLLPQQESYSLGKLCKSLGIPMLDRHRAFGDAQATVELLKILLEKDIQKNIIKGQQLIKPATPTKGKQKLTPKLRKLMQDLPDEAGVYYFINKEEKIIYIGKSIAIKSRVRQHFTSETQKAQKIQLQVERVHYEVTGTDLIAKLKESEEIKANKPLLNVAQKRSIFTYGLYEDLHNNGYKTLEIRRISADNPPLLYFGFLEEAKGLLFQLTENFSLCQKINRLYKSKGPCFGYQIKQCKGACIEEEDPNLYNQRFQEMKQSLFATDDDLLITGKGRTLGEKSFVQVLKGVVQGYGYYEEMYQIDTPEKIKNRMIQVHPNRDIQRIIKNHIIKNRNKGKVL